jgi:CheY-like chemotaxis protein
VPTKILVADDSATMRRVLEMTFAGEDASVVSVDSGDAALNKLGDFSPDVVFVDAGLAGGDGYEVARRIKAQPGAAKVAVIVMASQHNPYDDGKGRAVGVDDHISKPFDTQSVIDRVGQVLSRPRSNPTGEHVRPAAAAAQQVARPATPAASAPVAAAAAAAPPVRMAGQGTRLGMGAPMPLAPTAQAAAKPAPAPAPAAPLRPNATIPLAPPTAKPVVQAPAPPLAAVAKPPAAPVPVAAPVAAAPVAAAPVSAAVTADLASKLGQLGLTRDQIEGVLALSREVIEQVVWEVVPQLAEQLIKEELQRLTAE